MSYAAMLVEFIIDRTKIAAHTCVQQSLRIHGRPVLPGNRINSVEARDFTSRLGGRSLGTRVSRSESGWVLT